MKKLFTAFMILFLLAPPVRTLADAVPSPAQAAEKITALQEVYPDHALWRDEVSDTWEGLTDEDGAAGLSFLRMAADAAFGSLPTRTVQPVAFDSLRPGDIVLLHQNTYSVMILEKLEDHVTVVEATADRHGDIRVYWGRTVSKSAVENGDCVITRYPEEAAADGALPGDVNADGAVDGRDLLRLSRFIAGLNAEISIQAADVNGDGLVDGRDVLRLARYAAGQDVELK